MAQSIETIDTCTNPPTVVLIVEIVSIPTAQGSLGSAKVHKPVVMCHPTTDLQVTTASRIPCRLACLQAVQVRQIVV